MGRCCSSILWFFSENIAPCVAILLVVHGKRAVWETPMSLFCTGIPGDLVLQVFSTNQEAKARDIQDRLVPMLQVSWAKRLFLQP